MSPKKITVGNVEIISVVDTPMQFPWNLPFPNLTEDDFAPYRELYPSSYGEGMFATQAGTYVLRSQGKTVLCDTGIGPGPIQMLGGIEGRLLRALSEAGVPTESVDVVVHTHLHMDHVGWNLNPENVPNFPSAQYLAPQADWDTFSAALDANPQMKQVTPLQEIGRLELYTGETTITPELTMIPTPGHTPGHHSLAVSSAGERAYVMGDMAHHPAQLDHIDWCASFDMDHPTTIESRRKVFDDAEENGLPVGFCHFPEPFGKLVRSNGKRIFQVL